MGAALPPLPPPAHARAARMHAPRAHTTTGALGARAASLPPPQLRAHRLSGTRLRCCPRLLSRRSGAAAAPLQRAHAGSLPADILTSLQSERENTRAYLPHDVLRAAIQLDEACSSVAAGAPPTRLYISCERTAALLARNPALLGGAIAEVVRRTRRRGYVFTLGGGATSASQAAGVVSGGEALPPPSRTASREEVAAARRRLLRLLDAVEANAPEVLRGLADSKRTAERTVRARGVCGARAGQRVGARARDVEATQVARVCARAREKRRFCCLCASSPTIWLHC
jgi:hypothetical protein